MGNGRNLINKEETFKIIGAAMDVHSTLGCGFLEPVYQEALELELSERGIPFKSQVEFTIAYKDHHLKKVYIADMVVFDYVIIELKAIDTITNREEAQLINYLKASGMPVGLLINFGADSLEWKRRVLTPTDHEKLAIPKPPRRLSRPELKSVKSAKSADIREDKCPQPTPPPN